MKNIRKRALVLLILSVFFLAGCSGTAMVSDESASGDPGGQKPKTQETAAEIKEEVLFDVTNLPADWPKVVPLSHVLKVTHYERTGKSMSASGYGEDIILRASNFYINARKETGGGYFWEFDPAKTSVTTGSDHVFYYIDEEGHSLTIKFWETGDRYDFTIEFEE